MHELSTLLSTLRARRYDPTQPVWDIRGPGFFPTVFRRQETADFYEARSELLRAAISRHHAYHLAVDAPEVVQVAGVRPGPEKGQYHLEHDVDVKALERKGLEAGGWYLYALSRPEHRAEVLRELYTSDVFRTSPAELMQTLSKLGVTFLIASFYDDREWRVAASLRTIPES